MWIGNHFVLSLVQDFVYRTTGKMVVYTKVPLVHEAPVYQIREPSTELITAPLHRDAKRGRHGKSSDFVGGVVFAAQGYLFVDCEDDIPKLRTERI